MRKTFLALLPHTQTRSTKIKSKKKEEKEKILSNEDLFKRIILILCCLFIIFCSSGHIRSCNGCKKKNEHMKIVFKHLHTQWVFRCHVKGLSCEELLFRCQKRQIHVSSNDALSGPGLIGAYCQHKLINEQLNFIRLPNMVIQTANELKN